MKLQCTLTAAIAAGLLTACQSAPTPYVAADRLEGDAGTGEGRVYPPVTETEIRATQLSAKSDAGPLQRQYFVDRINMETSGRGLAAPIVVQGVGDARGTLVLMVSGGNGPLTPYIARALLARTTSVIRFAPVVSEMGLSEELDVYEVAAVLGFRQIVVTDGRDATFVTQLEVSQLQARSSTSGVGFSPIREWQ